MPGMSAEHSAAPGWYPSEGELTYWDGTGWTAQIRPRLSAMERIERLDAELATVMQGSGNAHVKVYRTSEFTAGVQTKPRVNHLLHFIIGLFTCGGWWLVWLFIAAGAREVSRQVFIDEWGRPIWG